MTSDERLQLMPRKYRGTYKKAISTNSRKTAIKAFCTECVGYVFSEIKECTDTGCSLYKYRPK